MTFQYADQPPQAAVIKVIGVGGGGGNAVQHMVSQSLQGVDFVVANTDHQALVGLNGPTTLQLGEDLTQGLGAGADPDKGRQAALDDREKIEKMLKGANMVFITAGMGGGTGTGAAPVVAEIAKGYGILTVAVVTKPFMFENRMATAEKGIDELGHHVDSLIAIPNEKLLTVLGNNVTMAEAFAAANDVLLGAVQGIADIIMRPGQINVDFADVRTVMSERGMAIMGTGQAAGTDRAQVATEQAIHSPLLEDDVDLREARGVVVNITTANSPGIPEFQAVVSIIREFSRGDSTVIFGTVVDPEMGEDMRVTVVATGLQGPQMSGRPGIVVDNSRKGPARAGHTNQYPNPGRATAAQHTAQHTAQHKDAESAPEESSEMVNTDYLDIPSFLRRQAD